MTKEKTMIKKEGSQRITFYAESPRYWTDEPLHCEDWSRDYSIMEHHELKTKSGSAAALLRYLLRFGDNKKIINALKDNYKSDAHDYDNALSYDRSRKEWILWTWQPTWVGYDGDVHNGHWEEEWAFCPNIHDVDIYYLAVYLSDETIGKIAQKFMTADIKIMSYSFDYYGVVSFSAEYDHKSEGICWLEKDQFLKFSGCSEDYWNGNSLEEIEMWLIDDLAAWSKGAVEYA